MPTFTVTVNGQEYDVDAPNEEYAGKAVAQMMKSAQPSGTQQTAVAPAAQLPIESGTMLTTPLEGGGQPAPEMQGPPAPPEAMAQPELPTASFPMSPAMEQPQQMAPTQQMPPAQQMAPTDAMDTVQRAFAGDSSAVAAVALGSAMAGQEQNLAAAALRGVAPTAAGAGAGALLGGLISRSPAGAAIGARVGPAVMEGANLLTAGINKIFDTNLTTPDEAVQYLLTKFGVPQVVTPQEQLVEAGSKGIASSVGGIGMGTELAKSAVPMIAKAGKVLAEAPAIQAVQGMVGGMAGEKARQQGAGTVGQMAAGVGGSLLTGGAVTAGRTALKAAFPAVSPRTMGSIAAAERAGIPVYTQDVFPPQGRMGQYMQRAGEAIPFVGTAGQRIVGQEASEEALRRMLIGHRITPVDIAETGMADALTDVFQNFEKRRGDIKVKAQRKRAEAMNRAMQSNRPVPLTNSLQAIDNTILKLSKNALLAPVVDELQSIKAALIGQDLDVVDNIRQTLGQRFDAPGLANVRSQGSAAVSNLYGPLNEDIAKFIQTNSGNANLNKWRVANATTEKLMKELENDVVSSVLERGGNTPENVRRLIFSQDRSTQRVLYSQLNNIGRQNLRAAIMQNAYENSLVNGSFNISKFQKQTKNLATNFGVSFTDAQRDEVRGLGRALQLTERNRKFAPNAETGAQAIPGQVASGISSTARGIVNTMAGVGGASVVASDPMLSMLAAGIGMVGYFGTGLAAKVYNSEFVRKGLVKLANAPAGTKMEMAAYQNLTSALETALRK